MSVRTRIMVLCTTGMLTVLQVNTTNAASAEANCISPNPDVAIAYCTDIIQSGRPGFSLASAFSNRGLAYAQKGQYARALEDYGQAIKYQPNFALFYNNRCYALGQLSKLEEALADCQTALRLSPLNPSILDSRAYVYLQMGKYSEAIRDYDDALRLSPKLVFSLYGRAVAELKSGNATAAAKDLAAAKAVDPDITQKMAIAGVDVLDGAAFPRE